MTPSQSSQAKALCIPRRWLEIQQRGFGRRIYNFGHSVNLVGKDAALLASEFTCWEEGNPSGGVLTSLQG